MLLLSIEALTGLKPAANYCVVVRLYMNKAHVSMELFAFAIEHAWKVFNVSLYSRLTPYITIYGRVHDSSARGYNPRGNDQSTNFFVTP
jgi:hypothetical protein